MLVFFIILFLTIIVILFLVNSNNLDRLLFQKNYNALCLKIQENERKFLSHELHDTVAQDLKGIQFITAELSKPGNLNERKIIELSHRADSTAKKAITNVRTLCYNLTPPELECNNLAEALATTCANFTNETNVECPLVITNKDFINSFDKDSQLYIFRIVNEALENIKKHAEAEEASVILREELKSNKNSKFPVKYLTLMIFDDGNGFDVKSYITEISINGNLNVEKSNKNSSHYKNSEKNNQIRHFGLRGIIDRVNTLGGKLEIKSAEGEGTEIKISIPYRRREKNEKHRSAR
nr:hypothetical protein [Treponema sp.]